MRQKIRKAIILLSLLVFPVTMNWFSPFLILQGGFNGIIAGSALLFTSLFIASLFFGRLFCSWLCPAGCLQDLVAESRTRKFNSGTANTIKWVIWIPWIGSILTGFIMAGGVKAIQPLYFTETGISVDEPIKWISFFMVVGIFLLLSFIFGKRAGCHSICWMSPFMIPGRKVSNFLKLPAFRLAVNPDSCSHCGKCNSNCPMSLNIQQMVKRGDAEHHECILCSRCADNCPTNSIRFVFGKGK